MVSLFASVNNIICTMPWPLKSYVLEYSKYSLRFKKLMLFLLLKASKHTPKWYTSQVYKVQVLNGTATNVFGRRCHKNNKDINKTKYKNMNTHTKQVASK